MTYKEFIQNIIDTRGQWNISNDEYYEVHHIIPKCMGGLPNSFKHRTKHENLIWLYPEEHYIAHKLLSKEHPQNNALLNAWCMMAFPKGKTSREFEITPEEYGELRRLWSNSLRGKKRPTDLSEKLHQNALVNDNYGMKGKSHSEEFKQKQRERMLKNNPMNNQECRLKISKANIGKKIGPFSEEHRQKIGKSNSKRVRCIETGIIYESITEASKIFGGGVSACCRGIRNTAGGYHWKYIKK